MKMLMFQQHTVNSQHHRPLQCRTLFDNRKPKLVEYAGFQLHLVSEQAPITARHQEAFGLCRVKKSHFAAASFNNDHITLLTALW